MIDAYQAMPDDAPAWLAAFVGNLVNPLHNSIADIIEYLAEREGFDLDAPEVDARILPFPQR